MGAKRETTKGVGFIYQAVVKKLALMGKYNKAKAEKKAQSIMYKMIDMQVSFIEKTNKKPTRITMGRKQQIELFAELDVLGLTAKPYKKLPNILFGMSIFFEGDDKLEVSC